MTARTALLCAIVCLALLPAADLAAKPPSLARAKGGGVVARRGAKARPAKRRRARRRRARRRRARVKRVRRDRVAGGVHWRIKAKQGVLHVWRPHRYRRNGGGLVVFVHGYRSTADSVWKTRHLAEQFRASRQNAIFIIVDGPTGSGRPVKFDALSRVLRLVSRHTRQRLPHGHIVAIGHSAGYRTIHNWLDYRYLDHVILLDALYSREKEFDAWLTKSRFKSWHRLMIVAADTLPQARQFIRRFKYVVRVRRIPKRFADFTRRQRRAPILFIRSQYGHRQLVTSGKVIPLLLRLTRLRLIK